MAPVIGKRKRVEIADDAAGKQKKVQKPAKLAAAPQASAASDLTVQIVTGDYEKVTHGLAASIPTEILEDKSKDSKVTFYETFLFTAHTASIRCLAISPKTDNNKRYLATGSADERINVYSLSTIPPTAPTVGEKAFNGAVIAENSDNKSVGSLLHHDRAISRLHFPTKGKLFSSAEDNTVAISRTRDWTMLSSIKAPIPKVHGRPSGDTAAPGEVPTGVNDFAIHPSQKLALSVSRGEKCMRLWNLMTGKKAGVLNFDRDLLMQVGETKYSTGEARNVLWDEAGQHYVVGFERGAALFGIDSTPRALLKAQPVTKLHQYAIVPSPGGESTDLAAVSTEDGRILLFSIAGLEEAPEELPKLPCIGQIGGKAASVATRLKDFVILPLAATSAWLFVAAGSDGTIWLWLVRQSELGNASDSKQVGRLLAVHKTQSRITCLAAFSMDGIEENKA